MPIFIWEGTTRKNEIKKGEMEATDERLFVAFCGGRDLSPLKSEKNPKTLLNTFLF